MGTQPNAAKTASGQISAAAYLKAPRNLPDRWRVSTLDTEETEAYLHLLSALSGRTDITGILRSNCPLAEAVERAFRQWFEAIYPQSLLRFYHPELEITLRPEDPETDTECFLKIAFGNRFINWSDFEIADEIEAAEKFWPGTGIAVLNALTELPFRHYLWTPENILDFVRELFWAGYPTERKFMEAENPDWLEQNSEDPIFPFTDERLKPLTQWERRAPAAETNPIVRVVIDVCTRIKNNEMNSFAFGTTFPTSIVWRDEDGVISDVLTEFEQEQQEMDHFHPHAGGTQWECRNLRRLEQPLDQIALYIRETEELAEVITRFKRRMRPWLGKKQ